MARKTNKKKVARVAKGLPKDKSGKPPKDHLDQIHEGESYIDFVEETRERVRADARVALGVLGKSEAPPLREVLKESGVGRYPLLALGLLVMIDELQGYGFSVLGPEVSRTLGVTARGLAAVLALKTLAVSLATLPIAAYVQKRPRRAGISVVTAFGWSTMTLFTGFVANVWGLLANLVADGASTGSVRAVHLPLLMDSYPPQSRVRILSAYRTADAMGNIAAPLLVGLLTAVLGFTWRGVFMVMGAVSVLAAFFAIRLKDPGFGKWDVDRVRGVVREQTGYKGEGLREDEVALGFFEITRRLFLIPTIRRVLAGWAVLGMLLLPLFTYLFFFLDDRWGMGPGARGLFWAVIPIFSISALAWFGPRGERIFRENPATLQRLGALFLGAGVVCLALAIFSPVFLLMVVLFGIAFAFFALLAPTLNVTMLSIVVPRMRPHASALAGIFLAGVGGFAGLFLLGGIDRRFGTGGAIASLALPGIAAAFVLLSAAKTVNADLDRMIDDIVEGEELNGLIARGIQLPMLACRHIDFAYGQLQVLFNADFTVDDGEIVALLGTNGAGKSTLLRVISGLGLPTKGTVRFRGSDITYLDAERRLRLGITQIPGGRAVFGRLSVAENMRVFGYSHGRNRKAVDRGMELSFEAFPHLAERRNQRAATLSGGEQQMLGLAKAFIIKPRLLLIDELSLGLSPIVVSELLEMVRRINQEGTAVVLVEQSVNIALSLVQHAYFMEKGEIRFDGRAEDLLARTDLLRSVFLEGASQMVPTGR